jgi:cell wall-associated NlpC family hydrolase
MNYSDLLGKPFLYGGRGPDAYDCYGLAVELYKREGLNLPDYPSKDDPDYQNTNFAHGADNYFEQVTEPQPLDIVLFQIMPRFISHCGVYVGHGRFVHILRKTSVTCEELASPVWENRNRGIYRFKR